MNLSKEVINMSKTVNKIIFSGVGFFMLLASTASMGEDIDLYISESVKETQTRPKVLLIFDNSGSMGTREYYKPAYNPSTNYDALDGLTKLSKDYIYYVKGESADEKPVPDSATETRKFLDEINGCQSARDILNTYGLYTGRVREYTFQGNSGSWTLIPEETGESIQIVDCEDDISNLDKNNAKRKASTTGDTVISLPSPDSGFPVDGEGTKDAPQYHTLEVGDSNVSWSGTFVTLYTANYLRWQQNDNITKVRRSRLEVAKESVVTLINSTPNVDFGLQVFNYNTNSNGSTNNGGRVVHGIQDTTIESRKILLDTFIDDVGAYTNTPLCETLYEASLYFGGKNILWGNDAFNWEEPARDTTIEDGTSYISPFSSCSDKVYIIYLTDGRPTADSNAEAKVKTRPETGQDSITDSDEFHYRFKGANYKSFLPALAGWMSTNDLNINVDGKQTASTYTVGFSSGVAAAEILLQETADRGDGEYFFADDSASLTVALTNVLAELEPGNETLTSASVAANNFDRTQTLDSVYYAMFSPDRGPRWHGNLKKYKVADGVQEGSKNVAAINEDTGHFSTEVQSYWSSSKDGGDLETGGVAEMLRKMDNRVVYSDLGTGNSWVKLNYSEASNSAAFPSQTDLATFLDVDDDVTSVTNTLKWVNGEDVDDEDADGSRDDIREDVFGDPLHSKPVAINYGEGNVYIVVGTNHGIVHMFKDNDEANTVEETWAFMPKEFLANVKGLRDNFTSADKIYGVDGTITHHIIDINGDGVVNGNDKVWLFFGFRRGGNSYYALDITNPTSPSVMWTIVGGSDSPKGDFTELGQTWSQPKVTYSKLNISGDEAKPVLIFGGGYDTSKDSNGVGDEDNIGRAIYMVDAETGVLKWSLSPTGDTAFGGTDSIPASIAILDSDGDGLTDRLYAGDTGGNVWRIDMPGSDVDEFSVFKLASLGGNASDSVDRRFFSEPSIVKTYITETIDTGYKDANNKAIIVQQDIPYDGVLIGSGDRSTPLGTDTQDVFFMIKDVNIKTQQFTATSTPVRPTTIEIVGLADYTDNPFEVYAGSNLTDEETLEKEALSLEVSSLSGWYINLEQSGEKSTASASVLNDIVYFTTYTPPALGIESDSCDLPSGQGWLYAVDLSLGTNKYNTKHDNGIDNTVRKVFVSEQYTGAITIIVIKKVDPITGKVTTRTWKSTGRKLKEDDTNPKTIRTYLYITEN